MKNRSMLILVVLGLLLSRIIASVVLPVHDDAFITYRYARNLVSGNGFVYNCVFRTKPATDSDVNRPPIPSQTGQ